jgi:hypothetical protein
VFLYLCEVCQTDCSLNRITVVGNFIIIFSCIFLVSPIKITNFPDIVNHCVRKPVREFGLSNESAGELLKPQA